MIDSASAGSWGALEGKLRPFIRRRVRSDFDADDVLQEVWLRVQRNLGALRDEERLGPWLYQVARSAVADHLRAAARHPVAEHPAPEEPAEGEEDRSAEVEVAGYVAPFVAMLPEPYRQALTLTELEGLTQKQAAEMLGISLSGMKSRVQRGRRMLRQALLDCCDIALDPRGRVIGCEPRPDGKLPEDCCS